MGAWLYVRLARTEAVSRIAPAVNALVRGKLPEDAVELAGQALRALEAREGDEASASTFTRDTLVELASKPGARRVKNRGIEMAHALIEALLFVDALPSWTLEPVDEGAPPASIVLADGRDGQLYAELANRAPGFEELATNGGGPVIDVTGLDDERRFDVSEVDVRVSSRAELEALDAALAALAAEPRFLVDVTWDRVDPARARPAFVQLRRLVRRAVETDGITLAWQWSV